MKKLMLASLLNVFLLSASAQFHSTLNAEQWVDSVFKTLSPDQKIAQLMVVRLSTIDQSTKVVTFFDKQVEEAIRNYNIGGICLFQGGPARQANIINNFQSFAKTPILVCIDGENGVGMRIDSVKGLPRQMMLGAVQDPDIVYQFGKIVGEQCKRMGIQVNYAPVVDINNNPANPVINDRSFGEDKYKVAKYGIQYMKGMQDVGVMGCAKHFPGHGDVSVDSHKDLPVINKTKEELDSLELYPFREIFKAGVGSVMVAHLYIPAIDNTANRATSISYNNVTGLLRNELGYKGLTFTDALEMKGVSKFFPDGEASVQSLIAGNDMLCLPGDIPGAIKKTKAAIKKKKLSWSAIDEHVKRVLYAKYQYGLANLKPINTDNLAKDLNKDVDAMWHKVAENSITVLRNDDDSVFPLATNTTKRVAYVGIGLNSDNVFARRMRNDYNAHVYYFNSRFTNQKADDLLGLLKDSYDVVIVGVHGYSRFPGGNNFGINNYAKYFIQLLQQQQKSINLFFGNPYAAKIACNAKVLLTCYEDDDVSQEVAADLLNGKFFAKGKLPVTICDEFKYGSGLVMQRSLPEVEPAVMGMNDKKLHEIDSIANDAIQKRAIPGCVILVARDGKIVYDKAFGYLTYENAEPTYTETIYDLASVTKIMATTLSVMKLYDEGKIDLKKKLKDYLPWTSGSNKENLVIGDILLHQAGLKSYIPMYKETVDSTRGGIPSGAIYGSKPYENYTVRVAENIYLRKDWIDTMYHRILQSDLSEQGKYVYSDNDFIFLGKIVEQLTGMTLDQYAQKTFYEPLHLATTGFKPRDRFSLNRIAPTENEEIFRKQLIRGDVHDPGAAMFGGVSGHAGLFSDAYDLAVLSQTLLNGGKFDGITFFKKETIEYFSAYHSDISRRGYGFDKPEKDNIVRPDPYPCLSASPQTFGHTGFTGTCVWIDPKYNLTFIFLSNRVNNNGDANRFLKMNVRPKVQEVIYQSMAE